MSAVTVTVVPESTAEDVSSSMTAVSMFADVEMTS